MIIGVPKEIKRHEYRVAMTPDGVTRLTREGHRVIIEQSAGEGSFFPDDAYRQAGAEISGKKELFREAGLIVKVKEPLPPEYTYFREGQGLFTFLHLAANRGLVDTLLQKNITALAYETLEVNGSTPLLAPMSEIAGRMSPLMGAFYLQKVFGGRGTLLTGVEGGTPARVLILGAGVVGLSALRVARGMGADCTVISKGGGKLSEIDSLYKGKVRTIISGDAVAREETLGADVIIGAVMVTGSRAPMLLSRELVRSMKKGSVIVDVAVDQGGCAETTRPTTHDDPVYTVDGVVHYAVANMPGAYPRTSTVALTIRTIDYISMLAGSGIDDAVSGNNSLRKALNTYRGKVTHAGLAASLAGMKQQQELL